MAIQVASSFQWTAAVPPDTRQQVADITARNAIVSGVRWEGMIVYVVATQAYYVLAGGIADANWTSLGGTPAGTAPIKISGPFTVTDNSSSALSGETTASGTYTQVDFWARIIRGTTVFARAEFSIVYRNGAWEILTGPETNNGTPSGMTFTVNATTGQITATADLGAGNATITLQKIQWAA